MPPVKVDPTAIPEELRLRVLAAIAKELEIDSAAAAQRRAQGRAGSGVALDYLAPAADPAHHPDVGPAHHPDANPAHHLDAGLAQHPDAGLAHHLDAGPAQHPDVRAVPPPGEPSAGQQHTTGEAAGRQEEPVWPPVPLPRRAPGVNGAPQPPARLRREHLPHPPLGRRLDPEALTEPLPRITGAPQGGQSGAADVWTRVLPVAGPAAVTPPSPAPAVPPEPAPEPAAATPPPQPAPGLAAAPPTSQAEPVAPSATATPAAPTGPAARPATGPFPPAPPPFPRRAGPGGVPPGGTGATSSAPPTAETLFTAKQPTLPARPTVPAPPHRPVPRPRRPGRPYRIAGLFLAIAALAVAGLAGMMLSGRAPARHAGTGSVTGAAVVARDRAVAWVTGQLSRTTVVACDPGTCQALRSHGVPASSLYPVGPGSISPLHAQIVVATAAVRARFGSRLGSVYAPAVLASFGTGQNRVDIRATAPHGAAAYRVMLSADLASRRASGTQLLHSNSITTAPAARRQLAAGQVDARLLIILSGMAAAHPVYVAGFGTPAPGAAAGIPLRQMDIAETAPGQPGSTLSTGYVRSVMSFLDAQHGQFRPLTVQTVHLAGGVAVLRILLPAPSPLGLLGPHA